VAGCLFLVELPELHGRERLKDRIISSVLTFEGE